MSDEMVMPTSDSPAGAEDTGMRDAFAQFVQEAAVPEVDAQGALSADTTEQQTSDDAYLEQLLTGEQPGSVPYERFREVNERAKQASSVASEFDAWRDVIDEFKQLGYNNAADIQAALQQQQQEQEELDIRNRYEQLRDANVLDPQSAYAQQEAEITKLRYERQMVQVQQYMLQQETSQAVSQFPLSQRAPEILDTLIQNGVSPTQAAQQVHNYVKSLAQSLVPDLTNRLQSQATPTPMNNGQAASRTAPANQGNGLSNLSNLLGIRRNINS